MTDLSSPGITGVGSARVHTGFHFAYNAVANDVIAAVQSQISSRPSYTIVVTGMSMIYQIFCNDIMQLIRITIRALARRCGCINGRAIAQVRSPMQTSSFTHTVRPSDLHILAKDVVEQ
jgi:hypothetical protein